MANIIDYVKKYGKFRIEERPFNCVDALVMAQTVFLKFENLPFTSENVLFPFSDLLRYESKLTDGCRGSDNNLELMHAMIDSARFGNMKVGDFKYVFDEERDVSYASIVYSIEDGVYDITFRGTDNTMVGWKEDFNLSYRSELLSHSIAFGYVEKMFQKYPGKYRIIGHSKGGNLAAFVSTVLLNTDAVLDVYNFDGPAWIVPLDFSMYGSRYHKYVPGQSIFGMLMEQNYEQTVIKANGFALIQHDPFKWVIEDHDFVYLEKIEDYAMRLHEVLNEWMVLADPNDFAQVVYIIFDEFKKNDIDTIQSIDFSRIMQLINSFAQLPKEQKDLLKQLVKLLKEANRRV